MEQNKDKIRKTFREFIDAYHDEITALQIIYNRDYRTRSLDEQNIADLYARMKAYNNSLNKELVFAAYADYTPKKSTLRQLVDIIQIIKYEWKIISEITPFADQVRVKYRDWLFERNANKQGERGAGTQPFTKEQMQWLDLIREYIEVNASIRAQNMRSGRFIEIGGPAKFAKLFGSQAQNIIDELNYKLIA